MELQYKGFKLATTCAFKLTTHNDWPCVAVSVREMGGPASGIAYWRIPKKRLQTAEDEGLGPDDLLEFNLPTDGREPDSVTLKTYMAK